MIAKHILQMDFLNQSDYFFTPLKTFTYFHQIRVILFTLIICLLTVKCFQVLPFNLNNSIKDQSFIYKVEWSNKFI